MQDAEVHALSAATLQHGYNESFEAVLGISEAKEVDLSLVHRRELWDGPSGESLFQVQLETALDACRLRPERSGPRIWGISM